MTGDAGAPRPGGQAIHIEDLVGAVVADSSGRRVGRVVDIEVRPRAGWEVTALMMGRFGVLDRFDTLRAVPYRLRGFGDEQVVAWADVATFENRRVTLRPGASPSPAGGEATSGTAGERNPTQPEAAE
ncbi:MAG TPA: hypothetical protein VKA85_01285 [Candidatus Limnocylindrales bacterium]|nr:hypothetical protein [Candidatus Limnocylindrales bacterium]